MINRRRAIHKKSDSSEEKNNQVLQNCHECNKPFPVTDLLVPESNNPMSGNDHVNPDLNQIYLCENCVAVVTLNITTNQDNGGKNYKLWAVVVLAIVFCLAIAFYLINKYRHTGKTFDVKVQNQTPDEIVFDNELYGLEDLYTLQEERVWYTLAAGIKSVIAEKPNKPSVFLLLYDNVNTESTIKCLLQDVTKAATKYLMKEEIEPLIFAGADLNRKDLMNDPGQLLVTLEDKVVRNGAMIVTNLENVHPKIAASFHFFCDRYSPLVEKAIYFFTVKLKQAPNVPLQKVAEETLHRLWENDLPDNKLQPLITRMTGNVLRISHDYGSC